MYRCMRLSRHLQLNRNPAWNPARQLRTQDVQKGPRGFVNKRPPPIPRSNHAEDKSQQSTGDSNGENTVQDENSTSQLSAVSSALANASDSSLLAPVHIPEDPHGVLKERHPATSILANSSIVIQRQLEMMNVFLGFEQANRYVVMDGSGRHIGYLAEQEHGIGNALARQAFRTHRSFTTHVFDREQREVLRFHRPFSWINSSIRVFDAVDPASGYTAAVPGNVFANAGSLSLLQEAGAPQVSRLNLNEMRLIGEAQSQWAPLRRKYNLFLHRNLSLLQVDSNLQLTSGDLPLSNSTALEKVDASANTSDNSTFVQFAYVNEPFLSWDFSLRSSNNETIGGVSRNFSGFAREIFTDTGVYALRMDGAAIDAAAAADPSTQNQTHLGDGGKANAPALGMTFDQRAVMLATAVSIDFDYFSRHSHAGGGLGLPLPIWLPGGGAAAEGAAAGGAAGAGVGAVEGAAGAAGAAGGALETAAGTAVGTAARGVGGVAAAEGASAAVGGAVGAGTIAGAEAMRGAYDRRPEGSDVGPPISPDPRDFPQGQTRDPQQTAGGEELWGNEDPWAQEQNKNDDDDSWPFGDGGGDDGASSGGGDGADVGDVFDWF